MRLVLALLLSALVLALPSRALAQHAATRASCVVAAHAIARGATLAADDFTVAASPRCRAGDLPADSLVGRITHRVIQKGEPLREPAVAPAPLVAEGDSVELVVRTGRVSVAQRGVATAPARLGEPLWVRLGAKRMMRGVVVAPGVVAAR